MQKTMIAALFAAGFTGSLTAGVLRVGANGPITVDGRLDEPVWAKAKWEGDFKPFVTKAGSAISQQTSFAILTDMTNLYVGVKCDEAEMEKLRRMQPPSLWNSDFVQLDISPTCDPFDYYQFAVMYHNGWRNSLFYSEGGNIQPDPCFSPEWETVVVDREGGWDVEMKIPLSSFYMTRNSAWKKGEWMLNVGRKRVVGRLERSNWSQLTESFREPKNMGRMDGFPSRRRHDDVMMSEVRFFPEGVKDGKITGELVADAFIGSTGDYEFSASSGTAAKKRRLLHDQTVKLRVPAVYPENGRYDTELVLRRGNGETYRRHSKVKVDFTPITVKLERPEYRGSFYPGQDSSVVKGSVQTVTGGELTITLEGSGIERAEVKTKDGRFEFATPSFREGAAELVVRGADGEVRLPIRKLAKTGHQMAWIANGQLVVDGRPTVSRRLAHPGYRGGEKMDRFISTADFGETREVREQSIEFGRLVPGSETSEGMQDQRPSDAVFAAIDRRIEELRDKDFVFYYLCDEPECRHISSVYLKHLYDHIAERDPYHVLRIGTRAPLEYLNCCDWFETHPYINPQDLPDGRRVYGRPLNEVGDFVSKISDLKRKDKCIGFYQTAFAYKYSNPCSDYPTFQEYVCHSWAGIIRGARTLIPYAYHDFGDRPSIFEGTRFMFKTIEVLEPFIVADNRTVLERTKERECVRYECNGDTLTVTVDFKTMDVKVEVTGEYAAKLPSYAETQARVDKAEYARTHRGNLLARDWRKLKLTSSLGKCKPWNRYKLVDGTLDMLAWKPDASKAKVKDRYLEVKLTDGAITFSRLELAGWHLENLKVKVRKGEGEWVVPAEKSRHGEEFAAGIEFAEPVEADEIRLEFARGKVELYEIEAYER